MPLSTSSNPPRSLADLTGANNVPGIPEKPGSKLGKARTQQEGSLLCLVTLILSSVGMDAQIPMPTIASRTHCPRVEVFCKLVVSDSLEPSPFPQASGSLPFLQDTSTMQ